MVKDEDGVTARRTLTRLTARLKLSYTETVLWDTQVGYLGAKEWLGHGSPRTSR